MENKSSQGATLSPVKLWSGNIRSKSTITVPNLDKYNVVCVLTTHGIPVINFRGCETGMYFDNSDDWLVRIDTGNRFVVTMWCSNGNIDNSITQLWGIG